jgi:hypothetical protein
LLLLEFQSFDKKLVDVLGLFVAEVGAEILHELDDAVSAQVLVSGLLEGVISGHRSVV